MGERRSHSVLSWAFSEELDSLIGDKREKLGSPLLGCPPPGLAGSGPIQPLAPPAGLSQPLHSIHPAPGPIPGKNPLQDLLGGHAPSCYGQTYSHLSPGLAPPGPPQPLFPQPDGHLELRAQPGTPQDSPLPAHTPPSHSAKLLAEPSPARTMHDTLLPDGDLGLNSPTLYCNLFLFCSDQRLLSSFATEIWFLIFHMNNYQELLSPLPGRFSFGRAFWVQALVEK